MFWGLYYKTLQIRNLRIMDKFRSMLLLSWYSQTLSLAWANTLAYNRICTSWIHNVFSTGTSKAKLECFAPCVPFLHSLIFADRQKSALVTNLRQGWEKLVGDKRASLFVRTCVKRFNRLVPVFTAAWTVDIQTRFIVSTGRNNKTFYSSNWVIYIYFDSR
jgi:hypothetical protein